MEHIFAVLAKGIPQTVEITLAAFIVSAVLGLPLALLRRSGVWPVRVVTTMVVEILRGIPPVVWLFIIYYVIGSESIQLTTFQAAVAGLGLIYAAHLSELYRAGLSSVPTGQWEAVKILGIPRVAAYGRVILPQAFVVVIPPMASFAINLLKDSSVASIIGATDITFRAAQLTQQDLNGLGNFAVAGVLYLALSVPLAVLARSADAFLSRRVMGV